MKCPICGQELRPGKKDPNYLLCYTCKKKFKAPKRKVEVEREEEEPQYSNIPPKKVREKREKEMKKAYDDMLTAGYDEEEDKVSKAPVIILAVAIVVVAAFIAYMLLT